MYDLFANRAMNFDYKYKWGSIKKAYFVFSKQIVKKQFKKVFEWKLKCKARNKGRRTFISIQQKYSQMELL